MILFLLLLFLSTKSQAAITGTFIPAYGTKTAADFSNDVLIPEVEIINGSASVNPNNPLFVQSVQGSLVTVTASALPLNAAQESGGHLALIDQHIRYVDTNNVTVTASALPTGAARDNTLSALSNKVIYVDTNNITVTASALPNGASTSANQTTIDNDIKSVQGTPGSTAPSKANYIMGLDGGNIARAVSVSAVGNVNSNNYDGSGIALTSQANGSQRALDVGIDFLGIQIDPRSITGNVASAQTDSGNPVKTGGVINLNGTTFSNGQRADTQMNPSGSMYVDSTGRIQSYSSFSSFIVAATATDIFTITGSATKTIKIREVVISGTNTGNTNALVIMLKRSTANSGGTSSTLTAVPLDSNNAAATAVARSYTTNPTLGTLIGNIEGQLIFLPTLASTNVSTNEDLVYGDSGDQPVILRGTNEVFAINLNGVALLGTTVMNISVDWTEE